MIKVLVLVSYYLPGYKAGGALRTIVNLVEQIGDEIDFRIITSDRDFGDSKPYPAVVIDGWNTIGKAQVFYISPGNRSISNLAVLISETPYDILYINSFFDPVFTIKPLLARRLGKFLKRPVIIAPRGEFSSQALALKRWKKILYIAFAKSIGLYQNLAWQASSDYEAREIRRVMGRTAERIVVVPDVFPFVNFLNNVEKKENRDPGSPLRICFLSRIVPIKNLDYALNIVSRVKVPVVFDIYGPEEDKQYWKACSVLMKNLPPLIKANYKGKVEHQHVIAVLKKYDLFFLPTQSENFGHAILESMLAGTPVLISNNTNWRDLEAHGVGWDLSLDNAGAFIEAIEKTYSINSENYHNWRERVRNYAVQICSNNHILQENRQLFINARKFSEL